MADTKAKGVDFIQSMLDDVQNMGSDAQAKIDKILSGLNNQVNEGLANLQKIIDDKFQKYEEHVKAIDGMKADIGSNKNLIAAKAKDLEKLKRILKQAGEVLKSE